MKRKLLSGVVAGVAALALTAGGVTYAAFSDFGDVSGNTVGAGILRLDLGANGGAVKLDLGRIKLGDTVSQAVWVTSDPASGPDATVSLSLTDKHDQGGTCVHSLGKALAEQSLGNGCTITDNVAGGTATTGKLSQVLNLTLGYYPNASAGNCASGALQSVASGTFDSIVAAGPSQLLDSANAPVVLNHGGGVCLGVTATWPEDANGPSTLDAAAQNDELDFNLRVDLVQQ